MSPPCIGTMFEDDNGGPTARGVSSTEIRVGIPVWDKNGEHIKVVEALFAYFNQKYEFYGRKLVPVYVQGEVSKALDARARGAELAAQNAFAALTGIAEWQIAQPALPSELARQGIVTIVQGTAAWWSDRALYDAAHPYVWSVYPSAEDLQTNLASFACSSLAGHPAASALDTQLRDKTRRFGVVALGQQNVPATSALVQALTECSSESALKAEWVSSTGTATLRTSLERLKSGGATTLVCVCEAGSVEDGVREAHAVGFHPEWLLTPSYWATGNDENWLQPYRASGQVSPPIRLGSGPKLLPVQARPWYQAVQQTLTQTTDIYTTLGMGEFLYPELLVLAAGIQGAGPQLTPDTFAAGLMATQFSNPGAGAPPYWQPSAGFGPGDHSLYDDYNVGWWSDTASALDAGLSPNPFGSWCYLDQGARYSVGNFPTDAAQRLFRPDAGCR